MITFAVISLTLFSGAYAISKTIQRPLSSSTRLSMQISLHGSQQTRSALVNWYLYEKNIPFVQKAPRPSNHPFGQVPYLTDGDVEVFESGAILLYLADGYGGYDSPSQRATYTKWVVWANSELDGLCFGKGMSGTMLDKPNKALDTLEKLLFGSEYLVNNSFSVADVAVASYLNYVPIFFRNVNPTFRPNTVRYMLRCAERPAFEKAFGVDHVNTVKSSCCKWLNIDQSSSAPKKSGWF